MKWEHVQGWDRGRTVIERLWSLGVTYFVFASGARSSPLIQAVLSIHAELNSPDFKLSFPKTKQSAEFHSGRRLALAFPSPFSYHSHFDERGASYHALGYIKATGRPAAVILTSGTAVANVMPAAVVATQSELPLVVLSADRPPELQGIRSNQTIAQQDFFGRFAIYSKSLPLTEASLSTEKLEKELELGMLHASGREPNRIAVRQGTVHFNLPFSKPLLGEMDEARKTFHKKQWQQMLVKWEEQQSTLSTAEQSRQWKETLPKSTRLDLSHWALALLARAESHEKDKDVGSILMVCGQVEGLTATENEKLGRLLLKIAKQLGAPVFIDIASPLHTVPTAEFPPEEEDICVLRNFPLLLGAKAFQEWVKTYEGAFETVLHVGSEIVSQSLLDFLCEHPPGAYFHIEELFGHYDPARILPPFRSCHYQKITTPLLEGLTGLCEELKTTSLPTDAASSVSASPLSNPLMPLNLFKKMEEKLSNFCHQYTFKTFSELGAMRALFKTSRDYASSEAMAWNLFMGNSMPVRSTTLMGVEHGFKNVFVSRGTSGIDGLVAMASGIGRARALEDGTGRIMAVMGDLSLLHDLNSLALVTADKGRNKMAREQVILGLVVVNNHEGTIFNHLPLKDSMGSHWNDFIFKHAFTFKGIAEMLKFDYHELRSENALYEFLPQAFEAKRSFLLELTIQSDDNLSEHQTFLSQTEMQVAKVLQTYSGSNA